MIYRICFQYPHRYGMVSSVCYRFTDTKSPKQGMPALLKKHMVCSALNFSACTNQGDCTCPVTPISPGQTTGKRCSWPGRAYTFLLARSSWSLCS